MRALIVSYYMPQAQLDSYSRRLFHLAGFLREADWEVTCIFKRHEGFDAFRSDLEDQGVEVVLGLDGIEQAVQADTYDMAILGFWHTAEPLIETLRKHTPSTRIVVDSGDLHFLRNSRRILGEQIEAGEALDLDAEFGAHFSRELSVYARADAVFTVSRKEADMVNDLIPSNRAYFVPDCEESAPAPLPLEERQGMFFVGNFEHPPNEEALQYLCREIVPLIDRKVLDQHPIYVAGNKMTPKIQRIMEGVSGVRPVGWVPSVQPYVRKCMISVVPLLHGAGTKRKVIQALSVGTPTVTTPIGIEGLSLHHEEHILVADNPLLFASSVVRLTRDKELWNRLATKGQEHIRSERSLDQGRVYFLEALEKLMTPSTERRRRTFEVERNTRISRSAYQGILNTTSAAMQRTIPAGANVLVVSKGDDRFLETKGVEAKHFPLGSDGEYAGFHPADGREAVRHLEQAAGRAPGAYLVLPVPSFWWLEHYTEFRTHLETRARVVHRDESACLILALGEKPNPRQNLTIKVREEVVEPPPERLVMPPQMSWPRVLKDPPRIAADKRPRALILGAYCEDQVDYIDELVAALSSTETVETVQRWVALGCDPPSQSVDRVTAGWREFDSSREQAIASLLKPDDAASFDFILVCPDDATLPDGFLDALLGWQLHLGFGLASPALTSGSAEGRPTLEQQRGVYAREFVGGCDDTLISIHRSAFPQDFARLAKVNGNRSSRDGQFAGLITLAPSAPGEKTWLERILESEATRGVIDAVTIHRLDGNRASHEDRDFTVTATLPASEQADPNGSASLERLVRRNPSPEISVVLPTYNRAALLDQSLASLAGQTLDSDRFEVIVVDDGSSDKTAKVCQKWARKMAVEYIRIDRSGIAAAKNLGVLASAAPIILFFDDDDIADPNLLAEHLRTHELYPLQHVAVLGYTDWDESLEVTPVMRFANEIGGYLFKYAGLQDGQQLDFNYFWGGRSSCKKSLLTRLGLFYQGFEFGSEDIELGFRLSQALLKERLGDKYDELMQRNLDRRLLLEALGLTVIFNRQAVQHMIRPVDYEALCKRCERQGRSQTQFARLHANPIVDEWCMVEGADERWEAVKKELPARVELVRQLEAQFESEADEETKSGLLQELHRNYWWTFDAFKIMGIAHMARGRSKGSPQTRKERAVLQ